MTDRTLPSPNDLAGLARSPATNASAGIAVDLLFTLAWPAAAAVSLSIAVGGRDVTGLGLLSIACGTMAAYGLDRLIDRREHDAPRLKSALAWCVALAAAGTGILACTAWWRFQVCLALALIAGAYVPLKRYIPKNVLTVVGWTAATATLPFDGRPPLDPAFGAAVLAVAAVMAANTLICDLKDVVKDRQSGVVGIAPWLGVRAGSLAAVAFGCLGAGVAGSAGRFGLAATALCLAILAVLVARDPARGVYRLLADGLVVVVPGSLTLLDR